jgi:hypothetical protein
MYKNNKNNIQFQPMYRDGVQEMFKPKRHKTRLGYIYNQLLSIKPTNTLSSMSQQSDY